MKGTVNVPSVYVLAFNDHNQVAFVTRKNTGYKDGYDCLPAGHVERGENNRTAAARELKEEIGVIVPPAQLTHIFTMQRNEGEDNIRSDTFFIAEAGSWEGEAYNAEPERHSALVWHDYDDLPYDKIMDFQAIALRAIREGHTYAELGWD